VGLSNILLDMYCGNVVPPGLPGQSLTGASTGGSLHGEPVERSTDGLHHQLRQHMTGISLGPKPPLPALPSVPLGLVGAAAAAGAVATPAHGAGPGAGPRRNGAEEEEKGGGNRRHRQAEEELPPAHRAASLPRGDRVAARDRAHGLLSGLTRLGTGWNRAEAW